jgi:hypothetical protein
MFENFFKIFKTMAFVIIAGASIVTAFYLAYVLIFLAALAVLFCIGWTYNNWDKVEKWIKEYKIKEN